MNLWYKGSQPNEAFCLEILVQNMLIVWIFNQDVGFIVQRRQVGVDKHLAPSLSYLGDLEELVLLI